MSSHDSPVAPHASAQGEPAGSDALTKDMHAQIEEAMRQLDKAPPARSAPIRGPRVVQAGREHRTGRVVSVGPSDIFLEFGPKELGVVPRQQWPEEETPKTGDSLEVVVDHFEPSESIFICHRPNVIQKAAWESLEPGQTIEARVTGVNKGGLDLEVAGHRAFMPAGQVSLDHIPDLSVLVGEKLTCVVQRLDRRGSGNIVLSRREIQVRERRESAEKLKGTLAEGQVVDGVVRKIMPFGVFVDLGGLDGLVHVSDLTHDRIQHGERFIQKYVKEGDKVRVQILKVDWEANRLSLGMKQTQADPFSSATNDITEGAEVSGRVTKILEFGAFVELSPGVEGLVHISELAHKRVGAVGEVLKADEVVRAKVLKIDRDTRRISLSIKALLPAPERPGDNSKRKGGKEIKGPSYEEIMKETPALRRLREKFGKQGFKGGIA